MNITLDNQKKIHKIKTKNNFGAFSICNRGIDAYNVLPTPIKNVVNLNTFKNNIKRLILSEQIQKIKPKSKIHKLKRLKKNDKKSKKLKQFKKCTP